MQDNNNKDLLTFERKKNSFDDLLNIEPTFNSRVKLPNASWYNFPNNIQFPICDPEILKKYLNNILSDIEGVRYNYNEKECLWSLEYGTKPIIYTIDKFDYKLRSIIFNKKHAALLAAEKAHNMFPHNSEELNIVDILLPIPLFGIKKWSNIEIYLSYFETTNIILIEFNKNCGDSASFHYIIKKIKEKLNDTALLNWCRRAGYLMFCDGVKKSKNNDIDRYLLDEMMKREICTFL
jgi:hypothetical protein